jgi:hypothetical protein
MDEDESVLCLLIHIHIVYHGEVVLERGGYVLTRFELKAHGFQWSVSLLWPGSQLDIRQFCVLPVKGNWETADPLRRARARADSNM